MAYLDDDTIRSVHHLWYPIKVRSEQDTKIAKVAYAAEKALRENSYRSARVTRLEDES
jgi:hypothetical protein